VVMSTPAFSLISAPSPYPESGERIGREGLSAIEFLNKRKE
jgi:hypothetical protein